MPIAFVASGITETYKGFVLAHVSSKQYTGDGVQMRLISEVCPSMVCSSCEATLEDAYIYIANKRI